MSAMDSKRSEVLAPSSMESLSITATISIWSGIWQALAGFDTNWLLWGDRHSRNLNGALDHSGVRSEAPSHNMNISASDAAQS